MVALESLDGARPGPVSLYRAMVERHVAVTGSAHARRLLEVWPRTVASTWLVAPRPASEDVDARPLATGAVAERALERLRDTGDAPAVFEGA
jgi:glutamate synthase domain-containing protein 3